MRQDDGYQSEIYSAQAEKAYGSLSPSLLVNLANSSLLVYVQWSVITHSTLFLWFVVLLLVTLFRFGCLLYVNKNDLLNAHLAVNVYIVGLFMGGLAWGAAGIVLFPAADSAHQVIVAFVLGGMISGATVSAAAIPGAFYFYCLPAIIPILYSYARLGSETGRAMSFLVVVFAVFSIATYRHIHTMIYNLILARIINEKEMEARRHAEIQARKYQDFLEAVLDNIKDGIVACDEKGGLTVFNRATQDFHGLPQKILRPDEWSSYYDLYKEDGKTPLQRDEIPLFKALQGEQVRNQVMYIIPKHGKRRILLASGQPLLDENGRKMGAVISMHDVTREKEAQQALQRAYDDLEQKVQDRTEELVKVNRELRREIVERRKTEKENQELISRLQEALGKVKTLSGFLPICASCKNIRDDKGYWNELEAYIEQHSSAEFTHGLCPDCARKLYPEEYEKIFGKEK